MFINQTILTSPFCETPCAHIACKILLFTKKSHYGLKYTNDKSGRFQAVQ